jgi:PP-loop superfamily ATP-utilizing enzyme
MKIYMKSGWYTVEEGSSTTDRRGRKWESLSIEANYAPIGTEIEEEEIEEILRKEGLII